MTIRAQASGALAIEGGAPVRRPGLSWPRWPVPAPQAEEMLRQVLYGRRWAISSPHHGELFERRFASEFASYLGARHCVPTDHGSSAVLIALESLGLAEGDAVLVPALTWTATATAVLRAGLLPVLADVDPRTGSIGPEALRDNADVRAVVAVHWACGMADVPAIQAAAPDAVVIEDAAQAHGARWQGHAAGTLGRLGCFSMQHSKVLTCGEGGAVVTDDDDLVIRLQELRADSRSYHSTGGEGELELAETATMMGANFCLDEFGAALLCAQLPLLDVQHRVRNRNYESLRSLLAGVPGVRLLDRAPQQDALSLYEVPIIFERLDGEHDNAWAAAAVTAEIGMRAYPPRVPLHRSPLLRPWTKPTLSTLATRFVERHRDKQFPHAEYLARKAVLLHHSTFLGDETDMRHLAAAVGKVARHLTPTTAYG